MLLAVLLVGLALVLGLPALVVLWPIAVVSAAIRYCLDRPARRTAWPVVAVVLIGAGVVFRVGSWGAPQSSAARLIVFAAPLVLAALIVLACGGPARIKARHARADERRRVLRAEAVHQRRRARKDALKRRTGLDVGLLTDVTKARAGRATRAVTGRLNRRLERHRPKSATRPANLLDLDQDVSANLSKRRSDEILDLAEQLDRSRTRER